MIGVIAEIAPWIRTPVSSAYDYYNPQVADEDAPQLLVVRPER